MEFEVAIENGIFHKETRATAAIPVDLLQKLCPTAEEARAIRDALEGRSILE